MDEDEKPREMFSKLMTVWDPNWAQKKGDGTISYLICCGMSQNCTLGVWDVQSMEIYNQPSNILAHIPGLPDV